MRKFIVLISLLLFGAQVVSAQRYYYGKGIAYLSPRTNDTAFRIFMDGVSHGEAASAYGAVVCYLTETGTPRNISKAEALIAKYAFQDRDLCFLAANYYAGISLYTIKSMEVKGREHYGNNQNDPATALKYAHYFSMNLIL